MPSQDEGYVKVAVPLDDGMWHGRSVENLWAEPLGSGRVRIKNIPAYALGVSMNDSAETVEEDGRLTLAQVVERSGHSTYRVIPAKSMDETSFLSRWSPLEALGCRYESTPDGRLYAIDVPPRADILKVYGLLEAGEEEEAWSFEEGHCGHTGQP